MDVTCQECRELSDSLLKRAIVVTDYECAFLISCIKISRKCGHMSLTKKQEGLFEYLTDRVIFHDLTELSKASEIPPCSS